MSINGIHHLGLTVADVETSAKWYEAVLGFERSGGFESPGGERRKVFLRHDGLGARIGLTEHATADRTPFDETRIGLDHLAFQVDTQADLRAWERRLTEHDLQFTPIAPANSIPGAFVLVLRDPDNIQLELFYDPTQLN